MRARDYFSELLESYPQSPLSADAKLGSAMRISARTTARRRCTRRTSIANSSRSIPPTRADYAQMQLGMVHFNQMLNPQRDQTETKEAIREFQTFVDRYPSSPLLPQVKQRLRESKDRLSDWDVQVGNFYLSIRAYSGAEQRYRYVLETTPNTRAQDSLYFHLAETLEKSEKKAEALPYYERLVKEFEQSEYLQEAKRRIDLLRGELKAATTGL